MPENFSNSRNLISRDSATGGIDGLLSPATIAEQLGALIGPGKVSTTDEVLAGHAADKWSASQLPDVVVFAATTADVAAVLEYAHRQRVPVTPRGAGVGYVGGCVPIRGGIVLSTARMNQILGVCPEDGVAVVQPGVITGELQAAVRQVGWEYPPDPASLKECSIGGNIATNAGGPRCLKYGGDPVLCAGTGSGARRWPRVAHRRAAAQE
jgi:glycolate oxidase